MKKSLSLLEKKVLKDIAKCYDCRLYFSKGKNHWSWSNSITIDQFCSFKQALDSLFHELGHYKNLVENKFPLYHRESKVDKIKSDHLFTLYSVRAEIYTDRQAQILKRQWLKKYKLNYKYSLKDYEWLREYWRS